MRTQFHLPLQIYIPDLPSLVSAEFVVVQRQVDSRFKSFVKSADFVRCEKKDPRVVFQYTKEDGNNGISLQIPLITSSEENVRFIEKHYAAPPVSQVEMVFEAILHFFCALSYVTCSPCQS